MKRITTLLCGAILALFACSTVQAGPVFNYNWSSSDPSVLSDNGAYRLNLTNEAPVTAGGSTDAVATQLSLVSVKGGSDTFGGGAPPATFKLGLTIQDGAASGSLFFTVNFRSAITPNTINTPLGSVSINPVTTNTMLVNGDTFTITPLSFVFPGPVTSNVGGSVGFHIDEKVGSGSGPPNDTPEPSTILLASLGSAFAGFMGWKKRRGVAVCQPSEAGIE